MCGLNWTSHKSFWLLLVTSQTSLLPNYRQLVMVTKHGLNCIMEFFCDFLQGKHFFFGTIYILSFDPQVSIRPVTLVIHTNVCTIDPVISLYVIWESLCSCIEGSQKCTDTDGAATHLSPVRSFRLRASRAACDRLQKVGGARAVEMTPKRTKR